MTESDKPEQPRSAPPPQYSYGAYPGSYPPPPPPPYGSYGGYGPPVVPKNGLGIAALVLAIIALVFVWSVIGGVVLGAAAVVLGFVGWGRVKRGEANNGGIAIAGIVLGILAIIVSLAFIAIWVNLYNHVGGGDYVDCLSKAGEDKQAIQQCADQFRDRMENQFSITIQPSAPRP